MPRNVSGTYTLPLPPVVPNTVIQAAWANTTTDDIAQGITDSLDRQGRGGMIAPFRLVDGAIASPALSFNAETGTGFSRQSAGVMAVSIMGVKVGSWSSTGYTGALAGPFNLTGDVSFTGRGLFADGTVALPSISFTSDPDTGIYKSAVGELAFTADATKKVVMNLSSVQVAPSPTASAPSLLVFAGINAGSAGYTIDMLGSGVGTDKVIVRWLNNAYTIERFSIVADSAGVTLGIPGALPMVFTTSNTARLTIDAAGNARFTGPMAAAPNFWVGETSGAAGTVGIASGAGASSVYWGNTSAGNGQLSMFAGGTLALNLNRIPGAVNYFQMQQSTAGVGLLFSAEGSDANINIGYVAKGTGAHTFYSNSTGAGLTQFNVFHTAAATRYIQVSGGAGVNPVITANAGEINCLVGFHSRGTNTNTTLNSVGGGSYSSMFAPGFQIVNEPAGSDNRVNEWLYTGTTMVNRYVNDGYTNAVNWLTVTGAFGAGINNIQFQLSNGGLPGYVAMWITKGAASRGNVGIGQQNPTYQLNVCDTGQVSTTGTVFDLALSSTANGATLYLGDTGNAAGNGGCIMFGAFPTPVASGQHFASIKACITDASGFTAGELFISTKNTSADTGSTACMRFTASKAVYDNRNLTWARDPGTTAGAVSNTNLPIGSIVLGQPTTTLNNNALTILDASLNNIRIWASGSGTIATITTGNWRQCGAVQSTAQTMLFIRVS